MISLNLLILPICLFLGGDADFVHPSESHVEQASKNLDELFRNVERLLSESKLQEAIDLLAKADVKILAQESLEKRVEGFVAVAGFRIAVPGVSHRLESKLVGKSIRVVPWTSDDADLPFDEHDIWMAHAHSFAELHNLYLAHYLSEEDLLDTELCSLDEVKKYYLLSDEIWPEIPLISKLKMRLEIINRIDLEKVVINLNK